VSLKQNWSPPGSNPYQIPSFFAEDIGNENGTNIALSPNSKFFFFYGTGYYDHFIILDVDNLQKTFNF
jgi:hypothetical protein